MKFANFFKTVALLAAASMLTAGAYASGRGSVQLSDPVQVNGNKLKAGLYTVRWDGDGPTVSLHFLLDGKEVATAPATIVQLEQRASDNAAEIKTSANDRQLTAIRFSGKKYELDLGTENSQTQGKTGDSMK